MLDALGGLPAWLTASALVLVIVAIGAWVPPTAKHLQLDAVAALAAFALPVTGGIALALAHDRGRPYSRFELASVMWTTSTLQLFCAVLVARSSMLGSVVFFPLLLFTAGTHGFVHRSTWSAPFPTLGTVAATLAGLALCRSTEQMLLLGLCGACAVYASLHLGTFQVRADENARRREQLRAAVAAQQLYEQMRKVRSLSDSLVDTMGTAHDMANALSLVRLSSNLLATLEDVVPEDRRGNLEKIQRSLATSTERIDQMLTEVRARQAAAGAAVAKVQSVPLAPVVHHVVERVARRYDDVILETDVAADVEVEVAGGAGTLERILENLLLNAQQGDGSESAERIRVFTTADARATAHRIIIEDDGPGFGAQILSRPPGALSTTKASGTGIGLYTVERLVTASGGTLVLENRPEGGARVCATLPRSSR